jgi:hypothetical protein
MFWAIALEPGKTVLLSESAVTRDNPDDLLHISAANLIHAKDDKRTTV